MMVLAVCSGSWSSSFAEQGKQAVGEDCLDPIDSRAVPVPTDGHQRGTRE
jgi:hypothetical protein